MDIISRKEAKAAGLKHYFTGKPCIRGHVEKRQTNNGCCIVCGHEKSTRWRKENPDRYKEINTAYRERNPELCKERYTKYKRENREKVNEYSKQYHAKNRDTVLRKMKAYRQKNKDKFNAYKAKRIAAKLQATPAWYGEFDEFIMQEAYQLTIYRAAATGIEWDVDHMIPLQAKGACGLHCGLNVQVIQSRLNNGKGNKMIMTEPLEWVTRL